MLLVNFFKAGIVTQSCRIGSWLISDKKMPTYIEAKKHGTFFRTNIYETGI
jgi:hypothetical protein